MAISKMAKVMIVSHRSEADDVLTRLQQAGIIQILNAEHAIISKDMPELCCAGQRPRELEEITIRLNSAVGFLKQYGQLPKGMVSMLSPKPVVEEDFYQKIACDEKLLEITKNAEECKSAIDKLNNQAENLIATLEHLEPWKTFDTPVEQLKELEKATVFTGLVPSQNFAVLQEKLAENGAELQIVGKTGTRNAAIAVCLNEVTADVSRLLRTAEFENVTFESMQGTVAELIEQNQLKLEENKKAIAENEQKAAQLAQNLLKLQTVSDYYTNDLLREKTRTTSPATETTVILEGWVRRKDYKALETIIGDFTATSLRQIEAAEGEEPPVEIENNRLVKPFEIITRLYGMPYHLGVDPTGFLAPFFALFFGLCLTDAGYGIIMVAMSIFFIKKVQGDKKFGYMLLSCSVLTMICGALTGGWFGDAIQVANVPALTGFRNMFLRFGFDPNINPMTFFAVSLAIGYVHLMFGIAIAFFHKLNEKDYIAAVCDHLTWLIMLNSLAVFGFSKSGFVSPELGKIFLMIAGFPAATILLFSHREGNIVARLGMGFYNLASTMFYIGDILSYVRLMALGMVTGGFAMAINQMAGMAADIPYVGWAIAILVLIAMHTFNLGISVLGSFVHSLRLQYVEFFPKFFEGGGQLFEPFARQYNYVYISEEEKSNN